MYALFIEVDADESLLEQARRELPNTVVPMARTQGAQAGYWLAPKGGRGISVTVYSTAEEAQKVADMFTVGQPPPGGISEVIVRTAEVREVIASL
jgi:hypothetical protein